MKFKTGKWFPLVFVFSFFVLGCPQNTKKASIPGKQLKSSMPAFELIWEAGLPNHIRSGIADDRFLVYKDLILVVRNNRLSHVIANSTSIFQIKADAIRAKEPNGKKVYVGTLNPKASGDIYFQYYKKNLENALSLKGLKITPKNRANYQVLFDFKNLKVEESKIKSSIVPTTSFNWVSPQTINSSGSYDYGSTTDYFNQNYSPLGSSRATGSGNVNYTNYLSGYSTTSYSQRVAINSVKEVYHDRSLVVSAKDIRGEKEYWRLTLKSAGSSSDNRMNFDVLAASSVFFMGTDSKGEFNYAFTINDPIVEYIRGSKGAFQKIMEPVVDPLRGINRNFGAKENSKLKGPAGYTPVEVAGILNNLSLINRLARNGAKLNSRRLMVSAIEYQNKELATMVISSGFDPIKKVFYKPKKQFYSSYFEMARKLDTSKEFQKHLKSERKRLLQKKKK